MTTELQAEADAIVPSLFDKIRQWGIDRNFETDATIDGQVKKMFEEAAELALAVGADNHKEIVDAIGDCVVVLTMIAMLYGHGMTVERCAELAYNQIKDRKGIMRNGKFIKYDDLTPAQQAELDARLSK